MRRNAERTDRAARVDWAARERRRRSPARIAAAVLLHALLLLALKTAFDHVSLPTRPREVWTRLLALAPPPAAPASPTPTPVPARVTPPRAPVPRREPPPVEPRIAADARPQAITPPPVDATPVAAAAPASSASAPPPLRLDAATTRLAIRDVARNPSLSAQARNADPAPGANERLAQHVQEAQRGDCSKGEFAGGGAGLLSLPFLALAAATGQCAK